MNHRGGVDGLRALAFVPIFLFLVWRFGRTRVFWLILALAAVSLAASEWGWRKAESANFFLAPTRAWELFAGSLAALIVHKRGVTTNNALSLLGLGAIVFAIVVYDSATPFPSLYALVPVGGVVLLILFAGETTLSARLLSTKGPVGIGLISYLAYLWHHPLFAFARIRSLNEPHMPLMVALIGVSMILAYFSWRFVEGPFRDRKRMSRNTIFIFSILGLLGFIGLGVLGAVGVIKPSSDVAIEHITGWEDRDPCTIRGGLPDGLGADLRETCFASDNNVFFLGDSHAEAIGAEVRRSLEDAGWNVISLFERGCLPILQTSRQPYQEKCVNAKQGYWDLIRSTDAPLIISASWRINLLGSRFDNQEGGVDFGDSGLNVVLEFDEEILPFVERSLAAAAGERRVVLVGQIPEAGWNVPERLAKIKRLEPERLAEEITTSYAVYLAANAPVLAMFEKLAKEPGLALVEPQLHLCDTEVAGRCLNTQDGAVLYRDQDHPSPSYAAMIAADIAARLGGI